MNSLLWAVCLPCEVGELLRGCVESMKTNIAFRSTVASAVAQDLSSFSVFKMIYIQTGSLNKGVPGVWVCVVFSVKNEDT